MRNNLKTWIAALFATFCIFTVRADEFLDRFVTEFRAPMGSPVELGVWNGDLDACKAVADKYGIPMIAIWSNAGCQHCKIMEKALMSDRFQEWQKTCGMVLCFTCSLDPLAGKQSGRYYYWFKEPNAISNYPFVRLYWHKDGKKIVDYSVVGDVMDKQQGIYQGTFDKAGQNVIDYIVKTSGLGAYSPVPLTSYYGGTFDFEESDNDRLELDKNSKTLIFDLVRDESIAAAATNNIVRLVKADGTVLEEENVIWKEGDTNHTVSISVSSDVSGLKDGDVLSLALVGADGTAQEATNHVYFVENETSSKNPLWIGERSAGNGASTSSPKTLAASAAPLQFGEWTMDLDVAKATVANAPGQANTLALVAGTLWCPDCNNVDKYFLEYEKDGKNMVQEWAKSNNVALVVVEQPRFTSEASDSFVTATLLSRTPGVSYYIDGGTASGRAYLTRKGVSDAAALEQILKNQQIVTRDTTEGGFHRFEDGNSYRMGVPIFVMLRKDGTVAARLNRFATESPSDASDAENYIKRFDEMLKIAADEGEFADPTEMANNYPGNGAVAFVADGGSTNGVLSHADARDVFKLSGVGGNALQKVVVSGEDSAEVKVSFVTLDANGKEVAVGDAVTGSLDAEGGVVLEYEFTEKGEFYVKVEAASITSDAFKIGNANADNFFKYSVSGSVVLAPQESRNTAYAADDSDTVTMRLVEGKVYRIQGIKTTDVAEYLTPLDPEDPYCIFYTAVQSGDFKLKCAYGVGSAVTYQIWNTGKVGFVEVAHTVKENVGDVVVSVSRTGGSSGELEVDVSVDTDNTTLVNTDGEIKYEFEGAKLSWADGESGVKTFTVKVVDDQRFDYETSDLVLNLALAENSFGEIAESVYTLTVTENDELSAGSTGFIGADPAFAKKLTVYAKQSKGATLKVGRLVGSDGAVSVQIASNLSEVEISGDAEDGIVSWNSHKYEDKEIAVSGIPAGKTAKFTLKNPTGGLSILSASNNVSVISVRDDAPEFSNPETAIDLYRYVASSNLFPLADAPAGKVAFTKLSGTLPAGLKATYDQNANALAIWGVATAKAGKYAVAYQAKDGSVAGLAVSIEIAIVDPTDVKGSPETANESVADSRTFKDIPLLADDGNGGKYLAGTLQLTIPAKGNASAKYSSVRSTSTVSLSAKSWAGYDSDTKDLVVALTERKGYALQVKVENDGDVSGTVYDPVLESELKFETGSDSLWSKTNTADAWKGYFTVALGVADKEESIENVAPTGYGYLTLKMDTAASAQKGEVTWSAMLPNGTKINGKGLLTSAGELAYLPILKSTSTDVFSTLVALDAQNIDQARSAFSADGVRAFWEHKEKTAAANTSWTIDFAVNGGFYDKTADLADCCSENYTTNIIDILFDTSKLGSLYVGEPGAVDAQQVVVSTSTISFPSPKPNNITISFNRSTGIAKGTVKIPYGSSGKTVSANWEGVVMQGFGEGCGCEDTDDGLVFLPFVCGSFYLKDKVEYQNGTRTATINVYRGGSATVDVVY